jgi:hypothetical protein
MPNAVSKTQTLYFVISMFLLSLYLEDRNIFVGTFISGYPYHEVTGQVSETHKTIVKKKFSYVSNLINSRRFQTE